MKCLFMRRRIFREIFREALVEWVRDHSTLLAASLAYYGLFSLAPLMIMILISIDYLFQQSEQGRAMAQQVQDLAGQQAPSVVGEIIDQFGSRAASFKLTVLSFLFLLLGAAGLFVHTKAAFRIIWPLQTKDRKESMLKSGLRYYLTAYILSFLMVTFVGILLLASSMVTAFLLPFGRMIEGWLPFQFGLLRLVTLSISLLLVTALFAVTYKTLFDVRLGWREVLPGSATAAIFLAIGNYVIEIYVSFINLDSVYGAAASLLIFLIWIYYSAQIFLFGAEFIKVQRRKKELGAVQASGEKLDG